MYTGLMSAPRTARQRARDELTREILAAARRQLAEVGASALSLRAVARELQMASSAIYRYFSSRDELLTALIIESYNELGAAAERGDDPGAAPGERWMGTWRAVRRWALDNRHEFALLYGTPVPGYAAPEDTIGPAGRMAMCLARITADAKTAGLLSLPDAPACPPGAVEEEITRLIPEAESTVEEVARLIQAWNRVIGVLSFELHGHFNNVTADSAAFFDYTARTAGAFVGLAID